jgi:AGZA family xanthine/uracil permease-like MFS transporter
MVYILAVQPSIMQAAGMDSGIVFTVTALSAGLSTLIMAFIGRVPIALASGLGINAYIAYTVCGAMGFTWQTALAAVFCEGVIFLVLSLSGVRETIIKAIPEVVKRAVAVGIGLFIAIVGLNSAGIIHTGGGTPLSINNLTSGAPLVAIIGFALIIALYALRVPGAFLIAILAATFIGIPLGVTTLPDNFALVSLPSAPYTPADLLAGIHEVDPLDFLVVMVSMLFIDMFDTISTLAGVAIESNLFDKNGNILNLKQALVSDALATILGALFGATTVTSFAESATGVAAGGRTGLTSVVTGVLFLAALFLSPLFLLIPAAATAPALIFVGVMMIGALTGLDLRDIEVSLPVFVTVLLVPVSYSISEGLAWGFVAYTLVKAMRRKWADISPATLALTALFLAKLVFLQL